MTIGGRRFSVSGMTITMPMGKPFFVFLLLITVIVLPLLLRKDRNWWVEPAEFFAVVVVENGGTIGSKDDANVQVTDKGFVSSGQQQHNKTWSRSVSNGTQILTERKKNGSSEAIAGIDVRGKSQPAPSVASKKNTKLEEWLKENSNKKVLLLNADNRHFNTSWNISSSGSHAGIAAMQLWAEKRNYAHIWVKGSIPGPYGKRLNGLWNKVPATVLALRLARRANISLVLFTDSDVVPVELFSNGSMDCGLESMLERYNASLVASHDTVYWLSEITERHVYERQKLALNSGAILFDTSEKAERILRAWWLETTNKTTPYETQLSRIDLEFTLALNNTELKSVSNHSFLLPDTISKTLNQKVGSIKFRIYPYKLRGRNATHARWNLRLQVMRRQPVPHRNAFTEFFNRCCGDEGKMCEYLIPPEARLVSMDCLATPFSTLVTWPGDQDRLSWLVDDNYPDTRIVNDLALCDPRTSLYTGSGMCLQHFCMRKQLVANAVWHGVFQSTSLRDRDQWELFEGQKMLQRVGAVESSSRVYEIGSDNDDDLFHFVDPLP